MALRHVASTTEMYPHGSEDQSTKVKALAGAGSSKGSGRRPPVSSLVSGGF